MGMVLHGVTHDIRHLREAAVVRLLHSMEDAALHRLQSVVDIGHRTVQYHIAGIVYPIVFEHAAEGECRSLFPGRCGYIVVFFNFFHKSL